MFNKNLKRSSWLIIPGLLQLNYYPISLVNFPHTHMYMYLSSLAAKWRGI